MKSIAFHIQKGGVGKTTLSGNIAHNLSLTRNKTILIDCDPQGNSSSWFLENMDVPLNYELANVLRGDCHLREGIIDVSEHFSILPTFGKDTFLKEYTQVALVDEPYIFCDLIEMLSKEGYEYAVFDLSPGMSILERSVLLATDEVIVPLKPDHFSIDGIDIFKNEIEKIGKRFRTSINFNKIVVNAYNKTLNQHNTYYKAVKTFPYDLYTISQDSKISECKMYNQSIFQYYPASKSIPELDRLTEDIMRV